MPTERGSLAQHRTSNVLQATKQNSYTRDTEQGKTSVVDVTPCSTNILSETAAVSTTQYDGPVVSFASQLVENNRQQFPEEQEDEITVDIMAPCYGGVCDVNANDDDIESRKSIASCLLQEENITDETATLLPGSYSNRRDGNTRRITDKITNTHSNFPRK